MQDKTNTAELCTDSSTSGHTIFITSGAPKHSTVDSCICDFDINGVVRNITISYSAGNANDNCGVNIDIDDGSDAFTCTSDDLVVQTLKSLEFSRSTTKETNYCLEINLGRYSKHAQ